ncbi:excisionase [Pantoea coffeiphila]|uniref:Excisionase n=1 Tax=Pantoea coffeiphila TaxID=1465635 RepID=A0A2S9I8B7_9GAMM|nr:excisionase [Pantoea coffeiphila]PRD14021.1 excisionase [Pantoea coffeiphila]
MAKLMTLTEWCDAHYTDKKPALTTLQKWARNGNFYPAAEKHGRQYRLREDAIYIKPQDVSLGKKIKETGSIAPAQTKFMEKVINGTAAHKLR